MHMNHHTISTTFLKFFVSWANLTIFVAWSHFIIQNNVPALIFVVGSGWQNVTRVELGSSLPDLPSSTLTWAHGAVEVSVNRKSLKDPINVSAFTIFLLVLKENESQSRDSGSMGKTEIIWDCTILWPAKKVIGETCKRMISLLT